MEKKLWKHKTKDRQVWAYFVENTNQVDKLPVEIQHKLEYTPGRTSMRSVDSKGVVSCAFPLYLYEFAGQLQLAHKSWFEDRYELVEPIEGKKVEKWAANWSSEIVCEAILVENESDLKKGNDNRTFHVEQDEKGAYILHPGGGLQTRSFPFYVVNYKSEINLWSKEGFEKLYERVTDEPKQIVPSVRTYRKIHTEVQAIQFNGENFEECKAFCPDTYRNVDDWRYRVEEKRLQKGQYIVKNHKGFCVKTAEEFEAEYREVQYEAYIDQYGQGHAKEVETPPYQTGALAGFGSVKKTSDAEYQKEAEKLVEYYDKVPVFEPKEPVYKLYRHKKDGNVVRGIFHNYDGSNTEEVKAFCGEDYCERNNLLTEWIFYKADREDVAETTIGASHFSNFVNEYEPYNKYGIDLPKKEQPTSMTERLTEDNKPDFQSWLDENFPNAGPTLSTAMRMQLYDRYLSWKQQELDSKRLEIFARPMGEPEVENKYTPSGETPIEFAKRINNKNK